MSKRHGRAAIVAGAVAGVSLVLMVTIGNAVESVFIVSPPTGAYWVLWLVFAAATFVVALSLGRMWGSATQQRRIARVATISAWAALTFFFGMAILWGAGTRVEGSWTVIATAGLVITVLTTAVSGIIGLATLPRRRPADRS